MNVPYLIRPATEADLPLLSTWRRREHVRKWWGDPAVEPEAEKLVERRVAMWVVEDETSPFAFIQDYAVADWLPHHFEYLPPGARGMDLYIGEASMVGQGHGPRLVRQHVDSLFKQGVPAVGIDPHPDNGAAQRAFEKAGFKASAGPVETTWGRALLMDRYAR
jgi:aminoglycoside 6'-N-acetyltransferase